MIAQALAFGEHGVAVFPVRLHRLGEHWRKRPHIREWAQRATADRAVIRGWWHEWPDAVVGVPLGRCDLVVVEQTVMAGLMV
jgi:hypothetical protein